MSGGRSTQSKRQVGQLGKRFKYLANALRQDGVLAGTGHKRITIPKDKLTETDLGALGFTPVSIAVPEAGQDMFTSFRHPDNNYHLHSHPGRWTMHHDAHASATMLAKKAKTFGGKAKAYVQGMPHVSEEGLPGLFYYVKGQLAGKASTAESVASEMTAKARKRISRLSRSPTFSKESAPRWAKMLEGLPTGDQRKILSSITKERTLRHLGTGGSRVADLVASPQHGIAVRKVPLVHDVSKGGVDALALRATTQLGAEEHLRSVAKNKGPFAHVLKGSTPTRAYYQYAPGPASAEEKAYGLLAKKQQKAMALRSSRGKAIRGKRAQGKDVTPAELDAHQAVKDELSALNPSLYESRTVLNREMSLGPEGDAVLTKMRERYPALRDVVPRNVRGGKLVDFEPESLVGRRGSSPAIPADAAGRATFLGGDGARAGLSQDVMQGMPQGKPVGQYTSGLTRGQKAAVAAGVAVPAIGGTMHRASKKNGTEKSAGAPTAVYKGKPISPDTVKFSTEFQGIPIRVDRPKGLMMLGTDNKGEKWTRRYKYDYGYIPKTLGGDGDGLDVFLGPNKKSVHAFWAIQRKFDGSFDEYKVFLGFDNRDEATAVYRQHIPKKLLAGMMTMKVEMMKSMLGITPEVAIKTAMVSGCFAALTKETQW